MAALAEHPKRDPVVLAGDGTLRHRGWRSVAHEGPDGTQASITVPADTLNDGWKVRWRSGAVSPTATSAWSAWRSFTVSLPKPTATGLTIAPSKVVDVVGVADTVAPTLQATLTHPTGQALRVEAEIEHEPSALDGQGSGPIWAGAVDNIAFGTGASVAVPAGTLTDGRKVRWRLHGVSEQATVTRDQPLHAARVGRPQASDL
ncbi:hypothetical protein E1267_12590 [Nonomuraea longispora]|uniref:Uncharacterized protein n=2 Tax=Nonomuraea longispora TaxID=1848320 RepID=A0A4R4NFB3_9ACTN|nr:hypothetical protein E1267_12590 [Nonomuraea longispora]